MNRFFSREEYRREIPRRLYARLDDLEPIAATAEDDLTFVFDAVDADWPGFGEGGVFDLNDPGLKNRVASWWRGGDRGDDFGGGGVIGGGGFDGYDGVPVYRVELTLPPGHALFSALPRNEEAWVQLEISGEPSDAPLAVYGGLFAPPVTAFLHSKPAPGPSGPLSILFDMLTWPDATQQDLLRALRPQCELEALVCFDVGQGLASALVCRCGMPIYYYDTGCGSGRNAPSAPAHLDFCTCTGPTVIMSHWDTDHWAGAAGHAGLQSMIWVVPRQTISTSHTLFANDILRAGGRILVVGYGAPPLQWFGGSQRYDLRRCTGPGRNGSGLALIVEEMNCGRSWVLTGDAGYHQLPHPQPADVTAMIVPHHGADMGTASVPYPRSGSGYARLFYSFGPGNNFGSKRPFVQHPVAAAVRSHSAAGWAHGGWSSSPPGSCSSGGDVIATATHQSTHLDGGAAGWTAAPNLGHLATCPRAMPVPQR